MRPVAVRILHPQPGPAAGPLERWVGGRPGEARRTAPRAGSPPRARPTSGSSARPPDDTPFGAPAPGARPRRATGRAGRPGLRLDPARDPARPARPGPRRRVRRPAGAREQPLLGRRRRDRVGDRGPRGRARRARRQRPAALAGRGRAATTVDDLRRRWRLGVDIDGPLDLVLAGDADEIASPEAAAIDTSRVRGRIDEVRAVAADRRAELLVAGRTSAATLAWLERHTASRTRALVEERGLRTRGRRVSGRPPRSSARCSSATARARSGRHLARSPTAAIVDSRVLLAHRLGADERALAGGRGPLRLGPAARRRDRRSVAARADRVRRGRRRSRSCSAATRSSARASRLVVGGRRLTARSMEPDARPPPRPAPGPRRGRRGRGARRRGSTRRSSATDRSRSPGSWTSRCTTRTAATTGRRTARPGPRRRLPDRAGGAPDLRGGARPGRRGRLGSARPAGPFVAPRVRRGDGDARPSPSSTASAASARTSRDVLALRAGRGRAAPARGHRAHGSTPPAADARSSTPAEPARDADRPASSSPTRCSTPCRPTASSARRTACARSRSARRTARSSTSRPTPSTPALAARLAAEGDRPRRRPARRDLPRRRWLGRGGGRRPRARPPPADRLRLPRRRALRPGPAPRRDAPRLPPPSRPRRPVRPRRPPGPDRPRRRHGGRAGGRRRRSRPSRHDDPGRVPGRARHRGRSSGRSRPTRPRPSRTTSTLRSALHAPARPGGDGPLPGDGVRARLAGRAGRSPGSSYRRSGRGRRPTAPDRTGPHRNRAIYLLPLDAARRARFATVGHDLTGSGARTCTRARRAPLPDIPDHPCPTPDRPRSRSASAAHRPAPLPLLEWPRGQPRACSGSGCALRQGSSGQRRRPRRVARREFG